MSPTLPAVPTLKPLTQEQILARAEVLRARFIAYAEDTTACALDAKISGDEDKAAKLEADARSLIQLASRPRILARRLINAGVKL